MATNKFPLLLRCTLSEVKISFSAFGSAVLDECLLKAGLNSENCTLGKTFNIEQGTKFRQKKLFLKYNLDAPKLHEQLTQAIDYLKQADTGDCKVG